MELLAGHNWYKVMLNILNPQTDPGEPMVYQIRIKGHLGRQWTDWLGCLTITLEENGDTLLTVPVRWSKSSKQTTLFIEKTRISERTRNSCHKILKSRNTKEKSLAQSDSFRIRPFQL
jgi:ERCC4-type nuclease